MLVKKIQSGYIWNRSFLYDVLVVGVLGKKLTGCAAPVFDRKPLAKKILVKNIHLAKEAFLIMIPFLHDFKEFQPKYSPFKINFPKTDANLAPNYPFLGVFVKNIPLAKDFGIPLAKDFLPKIHHLPLLRNLGSKSDHWSGKPPVRST